MINLILFVTTILVNISYWAALPVAPAAEILGIGRRILLSRSHYHTSWISWVWFHCRMGRCSLFLINWSVRHLLQRRFALVSIGVSAALYAVSLPLLLAWWCLFSVFYRCFHLPPRFGSISAICYLRPRQNWGQSIAPSSLSLILRNLKSRRSSPVWLRCETRWRNQRLWVPT